MSNLYIIRISLLDGSQMEHYDFSIHGDIKVKYLYSYDGSGTTADIRRARMYKSSGAASRIAKTQFRNRPNYWSDRKYLFEIVQVQVNVKQIGVV